MACAFDPSDLSDVILPLPDFSSDDSDDCNYESAGPAFVTDNTAPSDLDASPPPPPPPPQKPGSAESMNVVRVGPGPPGFGVCLFNTAPILKGEVVLEEVPLLLAEHMSKLPPLACFGPIGTEAGSIPMPSTAREIGYDGWPTVSAFDNTHLGLVLAWIEAPPDVQLRVFDVMQHTIQSRGGGGRTDTGTTPPEAKGGGGTAPVHAEGETRASNDAEGQHQHPLPASAEHKKDKKKLPCYC